MFSGLNTPPCRRKVALPRRKINFSFKRKISARKTKNVKTIFLLGSSPKADGRRGFALACGQKFSPSNSPNFCPLAEQTRQERITAFWSGGQEKPLGSRVKNFFP